MPECPICNHKMSKRFTSPCDYRRPNISNSYDIYWCPKCLFGQVWKRPKKEEVKSFYELDSYYTHDEISERNEKLYNNEPFLDSLRMRFAGLLDRGEVLSPNDVNSLYEECDSLTLMEIGCGNGANIRKFIGKGRYAEGIEPDSEAREIGIKNGLNIYEGTAEALPEVIRGRQYDIVLMSHVLEHCLDINASIINAKSMLKRGGIYIVETPNCGAIGFQEQKEEWPWSDIPRHLNFFTSLSLRSIVANHGFEVIGEKYSGFCRQFSKSWLATEKEIWKSFHKCEKQKRIRPNFKFRAWKLLFKSQFCSRSNKYVNVRIIAKKI